MKGGASPRLRVREVLADIDPGKAEGSDSPQRLHGKFRALVPPRSLRQPIFAGKRARSLLKRPLLVRQRKIHGGEYSAAAGSIPLLTEEIRASQRKNRLSIG